MAYPLITIGITCYNAADTIERAIASAVAQDWPNKEIIIVDDVSSDNSIEVIKKAINDIPYARLVCHSQNKKASGARNTIIAQCKGDYIAFFDDDDVSLPDRLNEQWRCLTDYQEKTEHRNVACYTSGHRHYPNGYIKPLPAPGTLGECPKGSQLADYLLFYHRISGVSYGGGSPSGMLFIPTWLIKQVGGFDEHFERVEDVDLGIRLGYADTHFIGTDKDVFVQYASKGNDKSSQKNLSAELKLAEKHKDYLQSVNRYYYAAHWPYLRHYHFTRQYHKMLWILLNLFLRYPVSVLQHFCTTAPRRFFHERKMKAKSS